MRPGSHNVHIAPDLISKLYINDRKYSIRYLIGAHHGRLALDSTLDVRALRRGLRYSRLRSSSSLGSPVGLNSLDSRGIQNGVLGILLALVDNMLVGEQRKMVLVKLTVTLEIDRQDKLETAGDMLVDPHDHSSKIKPYRMRRTGSLLASLRRATSCASTAGQKPLPGVRS